MCKASVAAHAKVVLTTTLEALEALGSAICCGGIEGAVGTAGTAFDVTAGGRTVDAIAALGGAWVFGALEVWLACAFPEPEWT